MTRKRTRRSRSTTPDSDHPRRPPPPPDPSSFHVPAEHEFPEGPDVQIIGESGPNDDDPATDVPVRVLTDFSIYHHATLELVPVARLLELTDTSPLSFSASGCVTAWVDHGEDDEDFDQDQDDPDQGQESAVDDASSVQDHMQRLKLTPIKRFSIHDFNKCRGRLDSNIYILTKYAWYILDMPSPLYRPFYTDFWLVHRVLHLVVSSVVSRPRITYDEFIASLDVSPASDVDVAVCLTILGRCITEEDVQSDEVKSYLLSALDDLQTYDHINIHRTPLFRALLGHQTSYELGANVGSSSSARTRLRPQSRVSSSNVELQVLKHRNETFVTTVVGRIAHLLFEQNIKLADIPGRLDADVDRSRPTQPSLVHLANPNSVKWGPVKGNPGYYESVWVDGVVYSVDDTVMVEPGTDEDKIRAKSYTHEPAQSSNSLANSYWFCRICYLFEDKRGQKLFHGQWLTHSSKTPLQELGHSQALYLMLKDCEDIPINAITQKCNVRELDLDVPEPVDGNAAEENDFVTGLLYDSADASFVTLSEEQTMRAYAHCDAHQPCLSCGLQAMESNISQPRPLPGGGYAHHEFTYHPHDFVYIKCKESHSVYKIGQIVKLKAMRAPVEITVQVFGRYDDVVRRMRSEDDYLLLASDDRRLFRTDRTETVYDEDLQGLCYVVYERDPSAADEWTLDDLKDWPENEFRSCTKCHQEKKEVLERQDALLRRHGRLRGLELFSGAGGLGTGFDLSGFVETQWAVEFSPSAARTYQRNHPNATVYNQCTNLCLQYAVDTYENKDPKPLPSLDDKKPLPPMPKPGEVDFIYGGPPCQSFSQMNHTKKEFDKRSTLPCNMIGYVEFYRPMYFLLENVFGILSHQQKTTAKSNGIQFALVKLIQRALASIGYQSKFTVLQAAQYGAPQGRKRVIFWGARHDVLMPEWPIPTHCSPVRVTRITLSTGSVIRPIIRNKQGGVDDDRSAPLHFVSIKDAIGDLPPFDWINPHVTMKATAEDKREARERKNVLKIPAFCPVDRFDAPYAGFSEPREYSCEPLSRYQKWMRRGRDGDVNEELKYHYTRRWGPSIAERVCAVPLVPGANQFNLAAKLRMELAQRKGAETKYATLYKRLDGDKVFATALTTVAPNSKGGSVLHPSQKRILSVQECARAQGFPDYYEFLSINDSPTQIVADQLRQIGNAVPVPLAYALGKSLGQALFKLWDEKDREGSPEV